MPRQFTVELPWAPSTNTFLRHFLLPGRKHPSTCISEKGREFYAAVGALLLETRPAKFSGPLAATIELYPPDRRSIDVDNRNKSVLDSLKRRPKDLKQWPGAWLFAEDDSQVKEMHTFIRGIVPGGKVVCTITQLSGEIQPPLFASGEE